MKKFLAASATALLITGGLVLTTTPALADDGGGDAVPTAESYGGGYPKPYPTYTPKPPQPDAIVTWGEWQTGEPDCELGEVTKTRTKYTTEYTWNGQEWVEGATTETTETETEATTDEQCPPVIPPQPEPKVTYTEWQAGEVNCELNTQTFTRTKSTTEYTWNGYSEQWVEGKTTTETERKTETAPAEECTPVVPPKPEPKVTVGEWKKGEPDCQYGEVESTRTTSTTDWVWDEESGDWVEGETTTTTETKTEAVTEEECYVPPTPEPTTTPVPAKASTPVTPAASSGLAQTGSETSLWLLPAAGLALLAGLGAVVRARTARR